MDDIVDQATKKFQEASNNFESNLKSLRTGRANASMLDGVVVEVYDTTMPLNQVAGVNVVDAQLIQITPYDPNNLEPISLAIRNNSNLGLNPSDDGRVVRVPIPSLTEERRREIARQITEKVEECMVRMRSLRHEALNNVAALKKDKSIGEDEAKRIEKQVEEAMQKQRQVVDAAASAKEKEILTL